MARDLYKMLSVKGAGRRRSGQIKDIFLLRRAESVEEETLLRSDDWY